MKLNFTLLVIVALSVFQNIQAQQIAFPQAEGAGQFTTGGRGTPTVPTTVFEVTRLDDPNPTVVGTLRYAIQNNSPVATYRTIVFRISGTIRLTSTLSINRANTTIAGQTAPGDGICIADYPVSLSANNVIIRHIRFRLGDKNQNLGMVNGSGDGDAFGGTGRKNIMIDHCTMSWSNDEAFTIYSGDSTTAQWNLISEPLDYSYHFETGDIDYQRHGYGGIWGGRRVSFHHNLIAHVRGRAPRFDGSRNLSPNSAGQENADFRNNVIYNWIDYNVNGGEGGNYNVVNNYYKYGPSTSNTSTKGVNRRNMIINPYYESATLPYGKYYLQGNHVDNSAIVTANNWLGAAMNNGSLTDTNQSKVAAPFAIATLNTETALDAYNSVLNGAGATLPKRDTLDERVINDVRNRTGRIIDVQGGYPHGTPYIQTVNAWPTLNSLPAPADTDKDGMPDAWETSMGLNPNDPSDRNNYTPNGYTQLENYLNSITSSALPLNLLAFKAVVIGKEVAATWSTVNEINTRSFDVEKSADGRGFISAGSIVANNSSQINSYSFTDNNPYQSISYYRLKMIDKDGSFTYSPIVRVNNKEKVSLLINPNPVTDKVIVSHPISKSSFLKLLNIEGKILKSIAIAANAMQTTIATSSLSAGTYYLLYEGKTEKITSTFIKQ